jgi:nucleoside-diphosphate-sugar epimerase
MTGAVLVTGGLGYVGRHLVSAVAERGDRVVSYNRDYAEGSPSGVEFVQGELYDIPRLVDTLSRHEVDRVIHTAAMSHPDLSIDLPITTFTANVDGTLHVLEAARMAGVKRVVNFSSECAYGNVDGTVTEDSPLDPTTPYGVTKVTTELLGRVYTNLYGLDVISLRVTEIYGPGNKMPEILRDIIRPVVDGEPFTMGTGGDHGFHFVHVQDVARAAILAAGCARRERSIFNITGGSQVTLSQAGEMIRDLIPGARIEIGPGYWHLDRQGPWDITAAARDLGYKPEQPLERGLPAYVEWLREHEY